MKASVHQALLDSLGPQLYDPHLDQNELEQKVRHTLQEVIDHEDTPLSLADRTRISQEVSDEILGHGPLEPLLRDSEITEIMVNGPDQIYVERAGKLYRRRHALQLATPTCVAPSTRSSVASVAASTRPARSSTPVSPTARVSTRSSRRSPSTARCSPSASSRPTRSRTRTSSPSARSRPQVRDFLSACVRGRRNIIISGGTGSGKTTLLNVVSSFIPDDERIVTIEDAAELQLHQDHVLRLESRPSNIEGRGADPHPRARQELAAYAARPHRRR